MSSLSVGFLVNGSDQTTHVKRPYDNISTNIYVTMGDDISIGTEPVTPCQDNTQNIGAPF